MKSQVLKRCKEEHTTGEWTMAKPIRATPTLTGEDAERFVKTMIREQKNPSPNRIATIRRVLRDFDYFEKQLAKA